MEEEEGSVGTTKKSKTAAKSIRISEPSVTLGSYQDTTDAQEVFEDITNILETHEVALKPSNPIEKVIKKR